MGGQMIEDSPFSHGPVPRDLSPQIPVLLINSDKINVVPCALPTQLWDIILTSEPSAYTRAFLCVCVYMCVSLADSS